MTRRNLLQEIYAHAISAEEAEAILSEVLDSDAAPEVEQVCSLSRVEWTAYAHGASLAAVARWRYLGWPKRCTACGRALDIGKFGWRVVEADGDSVIKHIRCS